MQDQNPMESNRFTTPESAGIAKDKQKLNL